LIRKRKQAFQRLLVAAGASFVLGLIPGLHWLLVVHLACDVGLGVYVWKLLQWKRGEEAPPVPSAPPSAELEFREPEPAPVRREEEPPVRRTAAR
jgi:flagellar biosynthesis component FlhA